jgi:hypothetical protein
MPSNIYKEKVLELEDKVYFTEQNLHNCIMFKKLFIRLAENLKINVKTMLKFEKNKKKNTTHRERKNSFENANSRENANGNETAQIVFDLRKLLNALDKKYNHNLFQVENTAHAKINQSIKSKCSISSMDKIVFEEKREVEENEEGQSGNKLKIENLDLKKAIQIKRIIEEIKKKDIIYLLNKIRNFEEQFTTFNFLNKQSESNIDELNIKYCFENSSDTHNDNSDNPVLNEANQQYANINSKIDPFEKKEITSFDYLNDSDSFYEKLSNQLRVSNISWNMKNAKIVLTKNQREVLSDYLHINLQILIQRITHLTQVKSYKNKQKNQISQIANDFFYDQKIVNNLTINFEKIEDHNLTRIRRFLRAKKSLISSSEIKTTPLCVLYDQSSTSSLRHLQNESLDFISERLK